MFGLSISLGLAQSNPNYGQVVRKFYETYQEINSVSDDEYLQFAKRKDGWYVEKLNHESEKLVSTQIFWVNKMASWENLSFEKNDDSTKLANGYEAALGRNTYMFDVCPYYGYTNWYADVIDFLEPQSQLTDTLLYALGKAYYAKASALYSNQYGFALPMDKKLKNFPPNSLEPEVEKEYIELAVKGIETYQKLELQNPYFETFVGSMNLQISNEYMSNWLNLLVWQNRTVADTFLVSNLYDPFIQDVAYNYLISCPKDAILFTNGDTDTYPLHYLQEQMHIREDVSIVNLSLLNLPQYVMAFSEQYKKFSKSFSKERLLAKETAQVVFDDSKSKTLDAKKLDQFIYPYLANNKFNIGLLPARNFKIKGKENNFEVFYHSSYLVLGDLMELDIIAQNLELRPVCYIASAEPNRAFSNNLVANGMVNILQHKSQIKVGNEIFIFNITEHANLLLKQFRFSEYDDEVFNSTKNNNLIYNYRTLYGKSAKEMLKLGDESTALALVEKIDSVFSPEVYQFSFADLSIALIYGELGNKKKARIYFDGVEQYIYFLKENDWGFDDKEYYLEYIERERNKLNKK